MKHVKLQNFDPEQIEFLARVSEQIEFFYIIYTPANNPMKATDWLFQRSLHIVKS